MKNLQITEKYTIRGTRSMDSYLREVDKTKPMTANKEYEVAVLAQAGDEKAQAILVSSNLRFVISVAKRYSRDPDTVLDLIAVGNLGLIDAAKKFDPYKGFKFISFAVWHIRKEMLDFLTKHGKTIRIPQSQLGVLNKVHEIRAKVYSEEAREATDEEILTYVRANYKSAARLEMSTLKEVMLSDVSMYSLDKPIGENEDSTILDVYDSGEATPEQIMTKDAQSECIALLMRCLTPVEKDIVTRRHGLGFLCAEEFSTIGGLYEWSGEQVRIKYTRAMKKMKIWARQNRISLEGIL